VAPRYGLAAVLMVQSTICDVADGGLGLGVVGVPERCMCAAKARAEIVADAALGIPRIVRSRGSGLLARVSASEAFAFALNHSPRPYIMMRLHYHAPGTTDAR